VNNLYPSHMVTKHRQKEIWSGRVYELRFNLGLTQEEMAARLGVTRMSVINWETGRFLPAPAIRSQIIELENQAPSKITRVTA